MISSVIKETARFFYKIKPVKKVILRFLFKNPALLKKAALFLHPKSSTQAPTKIDCTAETLRIYSELKKKLER